MSNGSGLSIKEEEDAVEHCASIGELQIEPARHNQQGEIELDGRERRQIKELTDDDNALAW